MKGFILAVHPRSLKTLLVLALILFTAPDWVAHAIPVTPITIQSGFVQTFDINDFAAGMNLQAPGFAVFADTTGGGPTYHLLGGHFVAQKGVPADFGGFMTVNPVNSAVGVAFVEPPFTYSGVFRFSAVIPDPQAGIAVAPFSFTGTLFGQNPATGQEVFNLLLEGGGVVQTFVSDPAPFCAPCPRLDVHGLRFDFATVPEPATWLLMATGLGLLISRRTEKEIR